MCPSRPCNAGSVKGGRSPWRERLDETGRCEIKTPILAHPDRPTRFGFGRFAHYAKSNGSEVLGLNRANLSPELEIVRDLMTIARGFSSRLHGLRNYRKTRHEALKKEVAHELPNRVSLPANE